MFAAIGATTGPGSQAERRRLLGALFARATPAEQSFLTRLLAGELHQGALEGVMVEAVARAAGVPAGEVRRALLLGGSLPAVAEAALSAARTACGPGAADQASPDERHRRGGSPPTRARRPPSRHSGPSGSRWDGRCGRCWPPPRRPWRPRCERVSPAAVEWKIDGIRIQVHRQGREVRVFTRTLDDITARLPEITARRARQPRRGPGPGR